MLPNTAQRSVNRIATRSQLSANWRTKIDAAPREGNNATGPTLLKPAAKTYLQPRNNKLENQHKDLTINTAHHVAEGESIRDEDDPRTLQAIAEGRRLYVGNMPYMAKSKDVEALFLEGGHSLFDSLITPKCI